MRSNEGVVVVIVMNAFCLTASDKLVVEAKKDD